MMWGEEGRKGFVEKCQRSPQGPQSSPILGTQSIREFYVNATVSITLTKNSMQNPQELPYPFVLSLLGLP